MKKTFVYENFVESTAARASQRTLKINLIATIRWVRKTQMFRPAIHVR